MYLIVVLDEIVGVEGPKENDVSQQIRLKTVLTQEMTLKSR